MQKELSNIKNAVNFCRTIPYYKNKLKKIRVGSLQDFQKIPIISKDDYINNTPPRSSRMLSKKDNGCFLFVTGGTISDPKYVLRDFRDIKTQYLEYSGLDINKDDVAINLFMPGIWGIFTTANLTLMKFGCKIIPYGGANLNEENCEMIARLMEEFKVNFLLGVPSTVISILSYFSRENKTNLLNQINKIFCLGEMVSDSIMEYIKNIAPNVNIKLKYGLMESAGIGYQCEYLKGNKYHIFPDRYVEIINSVPESSYGQIAVTTLNKRLIPLLRYKTGDIGSIYNEKCRCGQKIILRILGRNDNEIILASIHLSTDLINSIIRRIENKCSQIFQIILEKKDNLDCVTINIESKKFIGQNQKKAIEEKIINYIYKEIPDIIEAITSMKLKGVFINIVDPGSIDRIATSGKVKMIVDLRK